MFVLFLKYIYIYVLFLFYFKVIFLLEDFSVARFQVKNYITKTKQKKIFNLFLKKKKIK